MKVEGLRVSILREADIYDPLNTRSIVAAKAKIDGVLCGWKATAVTTVDWATADTERLIASLIVQILTNPRNRIEINDVPDVAIAEGMVA